MQSNVVDRIYFILIISARSKHTRFKHHQVSKIQGFENLSLWQRLDFFIEHCYSGNKNKNSALFLLSMGGRGGWAQIVQGKGITPKNVALKSHFSVSPWTKSGIRLATVLLIKYQIIILPSVEVSLTYC